MCHFVLVFFSPFSTVITSLGEESANLSAFRTFVRFVLVWICRFPLPLGVWEGLWFVIVALPGLFSYLFFQASFPDIFAQYQNPPLTGSPVTTSNKAWNSWKTTPFDWWQCQLNFALWCATAGCGVSADDHLQAKDPFSQVCIASMSIIRRGVCLWS